MASIKLEESARKVHPVFSSREGDVVLCSTEGTLYRIPSYVLRNTSGLFRSLLPPPKLPPCHDAQTEVTDPIAVDEKDVVVERILRLLSGLETPKWESFDEIEAVASLAEKWNAPGPISVIRSAITAPHLLLESIRLYAIATHFGWEEEAKLASTFTLTLSLYDERHVDQLQRLTTKDLMKLLAFHRRRRDEFRALVDSDETFNAGNATNHFCSGCGEKVDNHTWRELKARMFYEMDQRPMGDTLSGLDMEEWPESIACWSAKCRRPECGRLYYNKLVTLRDIQGCLDRLSTSI
ncbi:hypothetical protein D9615_007501 [Tricholomella constricta]|uniref:BTB domain-containing protein n=1 Tax=Tricholomella constricta TaxID=117010 RepID=A0A8H5M248_9AGAR|nr:hypothetical protein D9615_007501 [Tricholomella constricta]